MQRFARMLKEERMRETGLDKKTGDVMSARRFAPLHAFGTWQTQIKHSL